MLRFDIVLNNLVAWAVTEGVILLKSDGSPWRPIVHIEDISRAFLAAMEAPKDKVHNEAFNVGQSAHNYRIREIAEIVAQVVPGCRLEFADDAGPDTRSYRVSFEKIARVLPAFKPVWDAKAGAEQLHAAYMSAGLTLQEFEGPRYQRISNIRKSLDEGTLNKSLRRVPSSISAPGFGRCSHMTTTLCHEQLYGLVRYDQVGGRRAGGCGYPHLRAGRPALSDLPEHNRRRRT